MADEMEEIVADFVTEAEESLEKIDPLFIELETKGHDKDILHEIFRSMHTIKGAAGFLGFQHMVDVAHKAESIMKKLRDDEMSVSTPVMDVILKSVDMLRLLLQHIKVKDGKEEDTSALLQELDATLSGTAPAAPETPVVSSPPPGPAGASAGEEGAGPAAEQPAGGIPAGRSEVKIPEVVLDQPAGPEGDAPAVEDRAIAAAQTKEPSQTLRIDVGKVDKVMDLAGEIVLVRNRLMNIGNYLEEKYGGDSYVESLMGTVSFLDLVTSDMQLAVMKMRMQPLKKVFSKFPRLVRDLSNSIGKDIELVITGEGTEVDRTVIEHIGDPMVHIIRNSVDHGLETSAERVKKGKSAKGRISINAFQQGNQIIIEVTDDGKGIDVERVKNKALERRLITEEEAQRMNDETAINLIFMPGFSTMDVATELSGRGVGMDVVKTNISKLNGYVEVRTERGVGTTFRINIPLTLAIIHALMVRSLTNQYAIPLAPIEETLKVAVKDIENVSGQKVLVVRGKVLPLFELSDILGYGVGGDAEYRYVIVIAIGDRRFCITVDELLGQEEVVIKTVEGIDTNAAYIVGATITGDGKVVLIIDLAGISRNVLGLKKM
ncbi:MAG: chemotaxis protein CheA [Nitrospiraceae bacterium]|nr:chemotaxis protein CheA [Nitrospiraceae bacterium]